MLRKILIVTLTLIITAGLFADDKNDDWTQGAVWYRILPERFRNGYPVNDPSKEEVIGKSDRDWQVHPWASDWYKYQVWEEDLEEDFVTITKQRRFGGDLIGVGETVSYLDFLGVDVILLMPIFESPSIFKYDASTLHHVDNNFGPDRIGDAKINKTEFDDPEKWTLSKADELFLDVIEEARRLKKRVVLETQFAYCHKSFWAFQDVIDKQEDSKYKEWFEVETWDDFLTPDTVEFSYKAWQDNPDLPVFKQTQAGFPDPVKNYIINSTRRWMTPKDRDEPADGIDGWFVSNVGALNSEFWREWSDSVWTINPDAVILTRCESGETPFSGKGKVAHFDCGFSDVLQDFFIDGKDKLKPSEFSAKLAELHAGADSSAMHRSVNSATRIEQYRLGSMVRNANTGSGNGRVYDPRPPAPEDIPILKSIALFQMSFIGAPVILYGEESGMSGSHQSEHLKPMLWREFIYEDETYEVIRPDIEDPVENRFNVQIANTYRLMNLIRQKNPAMRTGSFETVIVDDEKELFVYKRKLDRNEVVVFLNNGEEPQTVQWQHGWQIGTKVKRPLLGKKGDVKLKEDTLTIELGPNEGQLVVKEK
jgi:glycosidase